MHPKEWEEARRTRGMPEELLKKVLMEKESNATNRADDNSSNMHNVENSINISETAVNFNM